MKVVELKFPQDLVGLAGRKYGEQVYETQIKPQWDSHSENVTLEFPEYIEIVSSSFVQGLFSQIIEDFGYDGIREKVSVRSSNPGLEERVWDRIY